MSKKDLISIGDFFGNLEVINKDTRFIGKPAQVWECKCKCGEIISVYEAALLAGIITSCKKCEDNNSSEEDKTD